VSTATHRLRPVEVEARQFTDETDPLALAAWCGGEYINSPGGFEDVVYIPAQEARQVWPHVPRGSWVLKDSHGTVTVLTNEQFTLMYEPLDASV
jgi:hypothetical protein